MKILGYSIINDPKNLQTLHVHKEQSRSYTIKDSIVEPWGVVLPHSFETNSLPSCLGINVQKFAIWSRNFTTLMMEDNDFLSNYIVSKLQNNSIRRLNINNSQMHLHNSTQMEISGS